MTNCPPGMCTLSPSCVDGDNKPCKYALAMHRVDPGPFGVLEEKGKDTWADYLLYFLIAVFSWGAAVVQIIKL